MPIIAGLGNIGDEYEGTRHNIGFDIVDLIAQKINADWQKGKGPYYEAVGKHRGRKIILLKPLTLMNRSGRAVRKALSLHDEVMADLLVCYDDINLELGQIRMRKKGSDGGHNGLRDIIEAIGGSKFPRLRFGIGSNFSRGKQIDYVLKPFSDEELPTVEEQLEVAADAALCYVREGIDQAMNKYN